MFNGDLDLSRDELWSIYVENLEYVLDHVAELLQELSGKTVITSDHGNYVGERASPIPIRGYGHPRGIIDDPVIQVPWLVSKNGNRRTIKLDKTNEPENTVDEAVVVERLRDLGYK
jgi:hypothetical protein